MEHDPSNPIDTSVEAALQLEELKQGVRDDVPALDALFKLLSTPAPAFEKGESGICMLADVRSYTLFKDSLHQVQPKLKAADFHQFKTVIENYLEDLERGVAARELDKIEEAKRFCLAFNTNLVARKMNEIYFRRERSDSRYVSNESSS
jgi:hypothetical protein